MTQIIPAPSRAATRRRDSTYFDQLVQLPNRAHFVKQVDECVRRRSGHHILALLDIDDFSAANEVMGHRFGDRLLATVAECLARALPEGVLLARVGPDTFGVLGAVARVEPRHLLDCVRQPLIVEGVPYKVSLTCGYVLLPSDVQAGADLVKDATIALKRAKRDHRGEYVQYLDHMGTEARARALLLSNLRAAIDDKLLFLAYQPQIDLQTGTVIGLEALLRWRTREGSFVPPDQFIPVAEASGLIVPLGRWVLSTACQAMRRLIDAGCAPQRMAVNVSMVQLRDPGFYSAVCAALLGGGLQGRHLELEITESVAVLPTQQLEATLSALRAMGISIAIDDFGTGYSSLSRLERLPLDRIKIDRSFVSQLSQPPGGRIAEMVAQLGRKLGLQVLAEGIEDEATWKALLSIGCQQGQGYHIARPMAEADILAWLQERVKASRG
ncbi:EAL domain-containing protein [Xylophilus rhododendri]|uniref:EAL domain-containing protein n=1 Tax=Xylophilus rhododendri TaxID=2697032 RepID=A0A857J0R4_9BURK|nr:EAL domain-containing protein [Xylophilus rhododendri]